MITVATNILKNLSAAHKDEICKMAQGLLNAPATLTLIDYKEKGGDNLPLMPKFFFDDIPLKKLVEDINLWDKFTTLLSKILNYSRHDLKEIAVLQFWFSSAHGVSSLNIFFSVNDEEDLVNKMLSLREKLTTDVITHNLDLQKGTILILGYSKENQVWQLNTL